METENHSGSLPQILPQASGSGTKSSSAPRGSISEKDAKILSILALFADNWNWKVIEPTTKEIWKRSLRSLPLDEIECGMERCLVECKDFPKIYEFMERTQRPGRAAREEVERLALPEPERHPIPMPPEFKAKMQELFKTTKPKR